MFYEFLQNNSGGRFDVDERVCHRLFIEANSDDEAVSKAEELGCYWDGVANGVDCPCCGDRWYRDYLRTIQIEKYKVEGLTVNTYSDTHQDAVSRWNEKYGKYECVSPPTYTKLFGNEIFEGKISFRNIEEYAQFFADEYGFTVPDARVYYKDGSVKEIYKER